MGYFRTVPKEIEECAMVDGATRLQALLRIILPIAIPGLVCAVLFAFTLSWNEFIYALTFTTSSDQITASVGITSELIRGDIYFWGQLMAGAVLGSIPIVILYVFFLDYYVTGLTAGAVESEAPRRADRARGLLVSRDTVRPMALGPDAGDTPPPAKAMAPVVVRTTGTFAGPSRPPRALADPARPSPPRRS